MFRKILMYILGFTLIDLSWINIDFIKRKNLQRFMKELNWQNNLKFKINDDWSLDIKGKVFISAYEINNIHYRINKLDGDITITNSQLRTIDNLPEVINGVFILSGNHSVDKIRFPKRVNGAFWLVGYLPDDIGYLPEYKSVAHGSVVMCPSNMARFGVKDYIISSGLQRNYIIKDYDIIRERHNNKVKMGERSKRINSILNNGITIV